MKNESTLKAHMNPRLAWLPASLLAAVLAAPCMPLWAQTDSPSAEQMIEQLASKPRTRSLRNLNVEAVPAPSLSLLIQFDFDSARVKPESQPALANLAQAMKSDKLANARFAIEGHTDAKGSAAYNTKLSEQRAQAVRAILKSQGVDEGRLAAAGKGSSEPANPSDPYAAENRRVRIVNLE
jgi:outer membrane protein OmpA-like peptidoglycan-associated protein